MLQNNVEEKNILLGIHGTSVSNAKKIERYGFSASTKGYAGAGVYFWRYFENKEYAKHLAFYSWQQAFRKGNYSEQADTSCCLIEVEITCANVHTISHGKPRDSLRESLSLGLSKLKSQETKALVKDENILMSQLFEIYYQQASVPIQAIIATLPVHKKTPLVVSQYLGRVAEAIIVRDSSIIACLECSIIHEDYNQEPHYERINNYAQPC